MSVVMCFVACESARNKQVCNRGRGSNGLFVGVWLGIECLEKDVLPSEVHNLLLAVLLEFVGGQSILEVSSKDRKEIQRAGLGGRKGSREFCLMWLGFVLGFFGCFVLVLLFCFFPMVEVCKAKK